MVNVLLIDDAIVQVLLEFSTFAVLLGMLSWLVVQVRGNPRDVKMMGRVLCGMVDYGLPKARFRYFILCNILYSVDLVVENFGERGDD